MARTLLDKTSIEDHTLPKNIETQMIIKEASRKASKSLREEELRVQPSTVTYIGPDPIRSKDIKNDSYPNSSAGSEIEDLVGKLEACKVAKKNCLGKPNVTTKSEELKRSTTLTTQKKRSIDAKDQKGKMLAVELLTVLMSYQKNPPQKKPYGRTPANIIPQQCGILL